MSKSMIRFFKHHPFRVISVIYLIFTIAGFLLWSEVLPPSARAAIAGVADHIGVDAEHLNDLGMNFTSEMMGGFIASVIIGYYFVWRDKQKSLPIKLAQHRELTSFLLPLIGLWRNAYAAVADGKELGYRELFTRESFDTIIDKLDLAKPYDPDGTKRYSRAEDDPQTWLEELIRVNGDCADLCSDILKTYNSTLDPKLFERLQELLRESGFLTLIPSHDVQYKHKPKDRLNNYFYADEQALKDLVYLCDWTNENYDKVKKHDSSINLKKVE